MIKKVSPDIEKMAEDAGFQTVDYLGEWKGQDVYQPDFNDGEIHMIGFPQFIISQSQHAPRWATRAEAKAIMTALWPDDEEE